MLEDKYVVFKREDWAKFAPHIPTSVLDAIPPVVPDAHVFRSQDVFAAAVLHTYTSALRTAAEILQMAEADPDTIMDLHNQADDWHDAAVQAENTYHKIPD